MVMALEAWDLHAAAPVARILSKQAGEVTHYTNAPMGKYLAKLSLIRARGSDQQPFDEYAEWLLATTPSQFQYPLSDSLEPLAKYPLNVVLASAAEKLFGQTNSSWSTRLCAEASFIPDLMPLRGFRLMVTRELEKTNICGEFRWTGPGQIQYTMTNFVNTGGGKGGIGFSDGLEPTKPVSVEMRWCDWIAFSLSNARQIPFRQIPFFNPFLSIAERNAKIDRLKTVLGSW
jgi:hypothetical protein